MSTSISADRQPPAREVIEQHDRAAPPAAARCVARVGCDGEGTLAISLFVPLCKLSPSLSKSSLSKHFQIPVIHQKPFKINFERLILKDSSEEAFQNPQARPSSPSESRLHHVVWVPVTRGVHHGYTRRGVRPAQLGVQVEQHQVDPVLKALGFNY